MIRRIPLAALLAFTSLGPLPGTSPTQVTPEGFDRQRLARVSTVMQGYVDRKELPGLVLLVARNGKLVEQRALGCQDLEGKQPMRVDSLFRIASMSKPITSVAVLVLMEEGRLRLDDPLAKFIPEFKDARVAAPGKDGAAPALEKPSRPITLRDLLTHRSGISYGFNGDGPVQEAYRSLGVTDGLVEPGFDLAENMARLARAPLVQDPGKAFHYGLGTDVLGRVIEVASGQSLDAFLQSRIFGPLKMVDTAFTVPPEKRPRFTEVCTGLETGGFRAMKDPERFAQVLLSPGDTYRPGRRYFSGGAGLVSTAQDYARFLQMLLNRGEWNGVRILSPKAVELMTTSHTHDLPAVAPGREFGLGVSVVVDLGASGQFGSPGLFGWSGIYGTCFWVDPKERLVAVLLAQRFPYGGLDWMGAFQTQVYQALAR